MRYWLIFQMAQQKPVPPTADPGDCNFTSFTFECLADVLVQIGAVTGDAFLFQYGL